MITIVKRVWLPVLVIVAIAVGGLAVANLRSVFGSDKAIVTPVDADTAENFNPKVVTYEIFGTGSSASINYADLDGKPQRTGEVSLPWSLTLQTTLPSVMPNIMAQGDGQSITCRVTVDDEVKDERTAQGVNAATYCLVKAA
ncbi:MmpS family transport accessory protein [Mycolicibacterium chlorophenolicum]|uniref:Putative membrane protein mmpS4 n=1 Tax=Mycolicibacterium chlorophenolicum TaxID=37916 RepID=A0A0J6V7Q0_9MYCO|nr:MmpS family transport accessory protein [Mycolicibacterium chlorophenolicum]KMO66865.1 putative membrane protein mmpS4 [Mycolicibacterium chlorophenolicum]